MIFFRELTIWIVIINFCRSPSISDRTATDFQLDLVKIWQPCLRYAGKDTDRLEVFYERRHATPHRRRHRHRMSLLSAFRWWIHSRRVTSAVRMIRVRFATIVRIDPTSLLARIMYLPSYVRYTTDGKGKWLVQIFISEALSNVDATGSRLTRLLYATPFFQRLACWKIAAI